MISAHHPGSGPAARGTVNPEPPRAHSRRTARKAADQRASPSATPDTPGKRRHSEYGSNQPGKNGKSYLSKRGTRIRSPAVHSLVRRPRVVILGRLGPLVVGHVVHILCLHAHANVS